MNDGKERAEAAAEFHIEELAKQTTVRQWTRKRLRDAFFAGVQWSRDNPGHAHATAQVREVVEASDELLRSVRGHAKSMVDQGKHPGLPVTVIVALDHVEEALAALEREDKP